MDIELAKSGVCAQSLSIQQEESCQKQIKNPVPGQSSIITE